MDRSTMTAQHSRYPQMCHHGQSHHFNLNTNRWTKFAIYLFIYLCEQTFTIVIIYLFK